jgi:preprotein translocase subunit SecG
MVEIIHTPLIVVHVVACLFLMLVVLLQPGKSGGLGGLTGAGAQQVFGGRGAGNFLTRTTWATATIFFATSITLAYLSSSADEALQKRAAAAEQKQKAHLPPPAPPSSAKK